MARKTQLESEKAFAHCESFAKNAALVVAYEELFTKVAAAEIDGEAEFADYQIRDYAKYRGWLAIEDRHNKMLADVEAKVAALNAAKTA